MKNRNFRPTYRFISETIQERTIEDEQELVCYLSNGVISNDFECPFHLDIIQSNN